MMIPYGRQDINQADIDAVVDVLQSDFLTQGPKVPVFEELVRQKVGAKYTVAANSATSALHIACMALGLARGDWLWTSPITFVASANCGIYCGADVDFVDIDPDTYNVSIHSLKLKLIKAKKQNRLPKVFVAVHLAGLSCDMKEIHALSKEYGFKVVEDASHAIGGKYLGEYVGNCQYSDITVFSFHPVKIITTAEGGMALTNDSDFAKAMDLHRTHGVTRDPALMTHEPDGPWYYQQIDLGYNYRMTELQAALGVSQLIRLDDYVETRNRLTHRYNEKLKGLPFKLPTQFEYSYSACHLYLLRLKLDDMSATHLEVFAFLRDAGIGVNLHYIPVYSHPYYQALGFSKEDYPNSEKYYSDCVSLPLHSKLTLGEQDLIIDKLSEIIS